MQTQRMIAIINGLKDITDIELSLLDKAGYIFYSTDNNKIGHYDSQMPSFDLRESFLTEGKEYIYYCISNNEDRYVLAIRGIGEESKRIAKIVDVFLGASIESTSRNNFIKGVLLNTISEDSIEALCQRYLISPQGQLQVIVVEATEELMGALGEVLSALLSDEYLRIKSKSFAIIKKYDKANPEFASFLYDMISSELLFEVKIGVGAIVDDIRDWHFSYRTAEALIEIGKTFLPVHKAYCFRSLAIPWMLSKVPAMDLSMTRRLFDCDINSLFLNNELIATANVFFKNNLNISDTAKNLYIHRNTLIYRLNRIHEMTGYDLRNFEDAMLFNLMLNVSLSLKSR